MESRDIVPPGVFGPLMAADLLDALNGLPAATEAEKQAAANLALNHKVLPEHLRKRVLEALGDSADHD